MSTCQQCGAGYLSHKSICTACGAAISHTMDKLPRDISPLWRKRFMLIEKAGGPALPQLTLLRAGQRVRVMFNLWALLFGPLYYLAKGMWRRALTILFVGGAAAVLIDVLRPDGELDYLKASLGSAALALFTTLANISYYRKMLLDDNGWW